MNRREEQIQRGKLQDSGPVVRLVT